METVRLKSLEVTHLDKIWKYYGMEWISMKKVIFLNTSRLEALGV